MQTFAWWPSVLALVLASCIDVRSRRIPNWLSVPYLVAGIVCQAALGGLAGVAQSFAGIGAAVLLFGLPCLVRAMGMGDLKLAAAAGAWIGPRQMLTAFVFAGIAGGIIAVSYALWNRSLGRSLDKTSDLVVGLSRGKVQSQGANVSAGAGDSIPYAPAIAVGVLFSFLAR